jgi:hypothetical protein
MYFAKYGIIGIDGRTQKPTAGADFKAYQEILETSRAIAAMRRHVEASREGRKTKPRTGPAYRIPRPSQQ